MPIIKQSKQIAAKLPTISSSGYELATIVGDFTTVAGLTTNDVIEMVILPAGYVPIEIKLSAQDLDTGAALTLDCGVFSGQAGLADAARTCGNEALAGSNVGQAGGVVFENKAAILQLAPTDQDRGIGLKIAVAAAGLIVGANIRMTMLARPKLNGV